MSVRLFHRGARLVFVIGRGADGDERWWAPALREHDWSAILQRPLSLLDLDPRPDGPTAIVCRIGRLQWTVSRGWVTIWLRLERGSAFKRKLVSGALLKAARYGRDGSMS